MLAVIRKTKHNQITMKHSKVLNYVIILLILIISSTSLFGQKLEPKKRVLEPDHTISSEIMDKDYKLYISFPNGYSNENATSYPVLYVVDGQQCFESFKSAYWSMNLENGSWLEDFIIVGIGSGDNLKSWVIDRTYEFNPYPNTTVGAYWDNLLKLPDGTVKLGGAAKFLDCIKTELVPFIEKNYKTNDDRGIYGHSYGGTFASYALVNSPDFFNRYGIHSPSYQNENEELISQIEKQFEQNELKTDGPTKVYLSVGDSDIPGFRTQLTKLCKNLENKNYKNTVWTWQVFEDETHYSVVPISISRTIRELYRKK